MMPWKAAADGTAGVCDEVLFRGDLLRRLSQFTPFVSAMPITSAPIATHMRSAHRWLLTQPNHGDAKEKSAPQMTCGHYCLARSVINDSLQ